MTDLITDSENKSESSKKTTPKRSRGRPKKAVTADSVVAEVAEAKTPEISDDDVEEFRQWKAEKAEKTKMVCDSPDDDKVYRMWKEESRMVKGVFRCREPEGGSVTFPFKKYKWDELKRYTMLDGEVYTIPLAVARHLNQNCSYPVHSHILGPDGQQTLDTTGKMKSRMNFESTEFAVS